MSFRFTVHRAITIAGVTTLDGILEGRLAHGAQAAARTENGATVAITIKTVAFVESKEHDRPLTTITIESLPFPVKTLEGLTFTGD